MKRFRRLCGLLAVVLLATACLPAALAAPADDDLLGSVSAKYESNGDPGTVSSGSGDLGGASYGAYQFAGNFGVPLAFARWCVSSGNGKTEGQTLLDAYEQDGNKFGAAFSAAWKQLAADDSDGFLRLQRLYVKTQFYDKAAAALMEYFGLDVSKYGIAFQNAVWSRTVQHGLGSYSAGTGFLGIVKTVNTRLPGGVLGVDEEQLITAIYEESGATSTQGTNAMSAATAGGNAWIVRQYGLEGLYMKYYSGNSSSVQAGVYLRLRVRELEDLLTMCKTYGGYAAPAGNGFAMPTVAEDDLVLSTCDSLQGWSSDDVTALSLSTAQKQVGAGAVTLLPLPQSGQASLTAGGWLDFDVLVNAAGFDRLALWVYLPIDLPAGSAAALTVSLQCSDATVSSTAWLLAGRTAGWHRLTGALQNRGDRTRVDNAFVYFENLPTAAGGKLFGVDDVRLTAVDIQKAYKTATIKADALYCRMGPYGEYRAFGTFSHGVRVMVMGPAVDGWYFCWGTGSNGKSLMGWCSGQYLVMGAYVSRQRDVNGDGRTDAADALLILRYAVGKAALTASQKALADVNADGAVNAADALAVLRIAVGKW